MHSLSPFDHGLRVVVLFVVSTLFGLSTLILAIVGSRRPRSDRFPWHLTALGALSVLVVCALIISGIQAGRASIMETLEGIDPTKNAALLPHCAGGCSIAAHRFFGGITLAALAALSTLCCVLSFFRHRPAGRSRRGVIAAVIGIGGALTFSGVAMAWYQASLNDVFAAVAPLDPSFKLPRLLAGLEQLSVPLLPAIAVLLAIAAIFATLVLVRRQQHEPPIAVSSGGMVAGLLVLGLGTTLFLLTRGHAADKARRVPVGGKASCIEPLSSPADMRLPAETRPPLMVKGSRLLERGPRIDIISTNLSRGSSDVRVYFNASFSARGFGKDRPRWQPIRHLVEELKQTRAKSKQNSAPVVMADKHAPAKVLEHVLASCVMAGYSEIQLVSARVQTFNSRVLGVLGRSGCYAVRVRQAQGSTPGAVATRPEEPIAELAPRIDVAAAGTDVATVVIPDLPAIGSKAETTWAP